MTSTQENKVTTIHSPKNIADQKPSLEEVKKMTSKDIRSGITVYAKAGKVAAELSSRKVGTIERAEGEHYLKLKSDDSSDGKDHWFPLGWVEKADDKSAFLNKTLEEYRVGQLNECPNSATSH